MVWCLRVTKAILWIGEQVMVQAFKNVLVIVIFCIVFTLQVKTNLNITHTHILACTSSTNTYLDRFYPNIVGLVIFWSTEKTSSINHSLPLKRIAPFPLPFTCPPREKSWRTVYFHPKASRMTYRKCSWSSRDGAVDGWLQHMVYVNAARRYRHPDHLAFPVLAQNAISLE